MVPELRKQFNQSFTKQKYQRFLDGLHQACGTPVQFRVCETPCFLPAALLQEMSDAGKEMVLQLVNDPEYRRKSRVTVPLQWDVPNEDAHPLFVQVDFGLRRNDAGELKPCLVELQAFPSLYGYQLTLAKEYVRGYELDESLQKFLSGLDEASYIAALRKAIVGEHEAENVVLLEVDPLHQKTLPDFLVTKQLVGTPIVDIQEVVKQGNKLFYRRDGTLVPIERVYNRTIVDELVRKNVSLPFDYRDALEVEWAGHPNWYFRISKFSLPFLKHESVPKTWFLSEVPRLPDDRENWVLKPLYSFAGAGITFGPTDEQIATIPDEQRPDYILQERVTFERTIETPHGLTQPEIRVMYLWQDDLRPVMSLIRMGREK